VALPAVLCRDININIQLKRILDLRDLCFRHVVVLLDVDNFFGASRSCR
jgi:hypothetical protein